MSDAPRFAVSIEAGAEDDLKTIADYLTEHASAETARKVLGKVLDRIAGLHTMPLRGSVPNELEGARARGYRQFVSGTYRIVYRVKDQTVAVVLVADGRRDMQALLTARLLGR